MESDLILTSLAVLLLVDTTFRFVWEGEGLKALDTVLIGEDGVVD